MYIYAITPEEQRLVHEEYKKRGYEYALYMNDTNIIGFCDCTEKGGMTYYRFSPGHENVVTDGFYGQEVKLEDFIGKKMKCQIATPTPEISEAVQKYLFSIGYVWPSGSKIVQNTDAKYLQFNINRINVITKTDNEPFQIESYPLVSLDKIPIFNDLMINGYRLIFGDGFVKVNDESIPYSTIKAIYEQFKNCVENKFQISTPTPEINKAVQQYLFSLGYSWGCGTVIQETYNFVVINYSSYGILSANNVPFMPNEYKLVSIHEIPAIKRFTIAGKEVEINKISIKIGCTTLFSEQIEQIYSKVK